MGASESTQKEIIDPAKNQVVSELKGTRYGDIAVYQNLDNGGLLAVSKRILHEEDEGSTIKNSIQILQSLQHDSIVQLLNVINNVHNEFCSSFHEIQQLYEYLDYDLEHDIAKRIEARNAYYQEDELWHILVSVIAALTYMKMKNYYVSDIRPSSILVNLEAKVKILPKPVFCTQTNSYTQHLLENQNQHSSGSGIYLSPKLLENLMQKSISPIHNASKTDVFTLALTIIECGLLKNITPNLYDFENGLFNLELLNDSLHSMSERYSQQLVDTIHQMLNFDETQRPDVDQVFAQVKLLIESPNGLLCSDRLYSLAMRSQVVEQNQHSFHEPNKEPQQQVPPTQHIDMEQPQQKKVRSASKEERHRQKEEAKRLKKEEKKQRQLEKKKKEQEEEEERQRLEHNDDNDDDLDDLDAEFAKYLPPEKEKEFDKTIKDENLDVDEIVKRHGKKHEKTEKVVVPKKEIIFVEAKKSVKYEPLAKSKKEYKPPTKFVEAYSDSPIKWVEPSKELKQSKKLDIASKKLVVVQVQSPAKVEVQPKTIKFAEPTYTFAKNLTTSAMSPKKTGENPQDIQLLLSKYSRKVDSNLNNNLDTHETVKASYTLQKVDNKTQIQYTVSNEQTPKNVDPIYTLIDKYGTKNDYNKSTRIVSNDQRNLDEEVRPIMTRTVIQDRGQQVNTNPFKDVK